MGKSYEDRMLDVTKRMVKVIVQTAMLDYARDIVKNGSTARTEEYAADATEQIMEYLGVK